MRIGIFGGSFDPVHVGHLILAEQCREQATLDEVWFVPTSQSPFKKKGALATDRQRLEMLQFATAGHEAFRVSSIEIDRGDVSYTVETLGQIKEQQPDDELFLLMGGDSLESFDQWKEPAKICQLAIPLVVPRPGCDAPIELLKPYFDNHEFKKMVDHQIKMPLIEISSTEIRNRASEGRSFRFMTPRPVEVFITTNKIYIDSKPGK